MGFPDRINLKQSNGDGEMCQFFLEMLVAALLRAAIYLFNGAVQKSWVLLLLLLLLINTLLQMNIYSTWTDSDENDILKPATAMWIGLFLCLAWRAALCSFSFGLCHVTGWSELAVLPEQIQAARDPVWRHGSRQDTAVHLHSGRRSLPQVQSKSALLLYYCCYCVWLLAVQRQHTDSAPVICTRCVVPFRCKITHMTVCTRAGSIYLKNIYNCNVILIYQYYYNLLLLLLLLLLNHTKKEG